MVYLGKSTNGTEMYINKMVAEAKKVVVIGSVEPPYRDWETDRKSTRLNSSHITRSRMPSSA